MWKRIITSNREAEFNEKIQRIVEKFIEIADTYFRYPVKSLGIMRVPFKEHDTLKIGFREPVEFPYDVNIICYSNDACEASISRSFTYNRFIQIEWVFKNGFAECVNGVTVRGASTTLAIYPMIFKFAMLFTSDMFKKVEEADISSSHGVASKWFTELLNIYGEAKNLATSIDMKDLYDVGRIISYVTLDFFHIRFGVTSKDVGIKFILRRDKKLVEFETDIPIDKDHISIRFEHLLYSVESKKPILLEGKTIRKIVVEFPEKVMNETKDFLRELFSAYLPTSIAVSYLRHMLY